MNLSDLCNELMSQRAMMDVHLTKIDANPDRIKISQRLGIFPLVLSAVLFSLFTYLLWSLFRHFNWFLLMIVIAACPILFVSALFLVFGKSEIIFDLLNKKISRSCSLFHFKDKEFALFPQQGIIKLTTRRESSRKNSASAYYLRVHPYNYSWFFSFKDYDGAKAFGQKLAGVLSFPLEDTIKPTS